MNKEDFLRLYINQDADNSITPFTNEIGFSLIRDYPKNTPFYRDGRKMFIKLAILEGKIFYSINMTKPEQREGESMSYILTDGEEYKKKVTNFYSDNEEPYIFDETVKKIVFPAKNRSFTLNEFIEILVSNHLSDRLFTKRILNSTTGVLLKILFWLVDKKYEKVQASIDKYNFSKGERHIEEDKKNIDPFFNYFYISKNILIILLSVALLQKIFFVIFSKFSYVKNIWPFGEFSVSNPYVILFFFLVLFICEKFSLWLNNKVNEFFEDDKHSFKEKKINFIECLHNYQYKDKFNLKLN